MDYEKTVSILLPKEIKIPKEKIHFKAKIGYSSKGSDIDNFVKPFMDILQKKYDFNDNKIYLMTLEKTIVKKGKEFIIFDFCEYD